MHCPDPRPNLPIYPARPRPTLYGAVMRPYMPFMAALVLFGAVACGASSSSRSSASPSRATAAQAPKKAAALDKATCLKVMAGPYDTKAQATAYVTVLEGQASQEGVDNTLA